jgi:hypothetical protein
MTTAALHAAAFYHEVATKRAVWTIRDSEGFPAPLNGEGKRSMPFWSCESRARKIIANAPAYKAFEPVKIEWASFVTKWIPGLAKDGLVVGVNRSGAGALGYDIEPGDVQRNVEAIVASSGGVS